MIRFCCVSQLVIRWKHFKKQLQQHQLQWQEGREAYEQWKIAKTASSCRGGTTNLTLLTSFFITFLAQYSTSNVKAWSWLSPLQTAIVQKLKETDLAKWKDFCWQFLHSELLEDIELFLLWCIFWIEWVCKRTKNVLLVG